MPAVIASLRFGALAIRSAVRYAGQNGWEITTSASGSSRSKHRVGAVLVGGDDQRVALALQEAAQAELAGDAAEQVRRA